MRERDGSGCHDGRVGAQVECGEGTCGRLSHDGGEQCRAFRSDQVPRKVETCELRAISNRLRERGARGIGGAREGESERAKGWAVGECTGKRLDTLLVKLKRKNPVM